jgi:hypothetical protein
MMLQLFEGLDITEESASWMASGMRALAACDGFHTAELALIDEFERGLNIEPTDGGDFDARTCPFDAPEAREVFVRSLQLMALADGRQSSREEAWIDRACECLGIAAQRKDELEREAKKFLLSSLAGVTAFRGQAVSIGESLGLSADDIDEVLG